MEKETTEVLEQSKEDKFRLVIVTGMSGGGKTQACRYMEDLGYFVVDNLPPVFIPKFVELCKHAGDHVGKVVLVVDTRSREFFDTFIHVLDDMDKDDVPYEMLFMDASDPVIIRRYKETRRRHPMAPSSRISDGIAKERERLSPARAKATYIIDTSELKKVELRDKIHRIFGNSDGEQMSINVLSHKRECLSHLRLLGIMHHEHTIAQIEGNCGVFRVKRVSVARQVVESG